jgi:hypothetical protein
VQFDHDIDLIRIQGETKHNAILSASSRQVCAVPVSQGTKVRVWEDGLPGHGVDQDGNDQQGRPHQDADQTKDTLPPLKIQKLH